MNKKLVRAIMGEQGISGLPQNRDFERAGPNILPMTDITEHLTREGRVFCCAVLDAWSRKAVGWSTDRRPPQYTSWAFAQRIRSDGLVHSLGTVGDAFDNAMVESFWGRMQTEFLDRQKWVTRLELSATIFDRIEAFHNPVQHHSALGYTSPIEFERRNQQTTTAA